MSKKPRQLSVDISQQSNPSAPSESPDPQHCISQSLLIDSEPATSITEVRRRLFTEETDTDDPSPSRSTPRSARIQQYPPLHSTTRLHGNVQPSSSRMGTTSPIRHSEGLVGSTDKDAFMPSTSQVFSPLPTPDRLILTQVPATHAHSVFENDDSLDADDAPFSQEQDEIVGMVNGWDESDTESNSSHSDDSMVSDAELMSLRNPTGFLSNAMTAPAYANEVSEDLFSGLFYEPDDERWTTVEEESDSADEEIADSMLLPRLAERASNYQEGGLPNWDYTSPFVDVDVAFDDVNSSLTGRYITEANEIVRKIVDDVDTRRIMQRGDLSTARRSESQQYFDSAPPTRLEVVKSFLPESLLEKLAAVANRALRLRRKSPTSATEILGLIILHVLCASYDESPCTVCDPAEADNFLQTGISSKRYKEVWSALAGTDERRSVVDYTPTGWCRSNNRSTAVILEVEHEVASCNRRLLHVPGTTILSLDDDHLRMASRAVTRLTSLQQYNNPKKGLGPVGNALCSALHPVFFACHFTRVGDKILDIWQRLIQLLQGAATSGSLHPMTDTIIAADRGYNSREVLQFLSNVLGASLLGTHKRDLWYPFVFGDGAIRVRHRGMIVSERGCRAIYNARLKTASVGGQGRQVEAVLYRESCSGRIAAMILNNPRRFRSRGFTIVPHERFRGEVDNLEKVVESQTLFDTMEAKRRADNSAPLNPGRMCVEQVLNRVMSLTFLQSEDPVWFLLRAFRFTSRTAHGFLEAVASNFDQNIEGLAHLLKGRRISRGSDPLPLDENTCVQLLRSRWDVLLNVLGIKPRHAPFEMNSLALKDLVLAMSLSTIRAERMQNLRDLLVKLGRMPEVDGRLLKRHLVDALVTAQNDLRSGSLIVPDTNPSQGPVQTPTGKSRVVVSSLQEASLQAWVMKPLVATAGMKEGSFNEIYALRGLPKFFQTITRTYAKGRDGNPNSDERGYRSYKERTLKLSYIRTSGLVSSKSSPMMADSPDALCAAFDTGGDGSTFCAAIEVKTMTAPRTVEDSKRLADEYGQFCVVTDICTDSKSLELFKKLVPSTGYRSQCMHHAAVLGVRWVIFVVAKGGRVATGGIIYAALIEFKDSLRNCYTWALDAVRHSAFLWVELSPKDIPEEYDSMLKTSHASDLHSFATYFSLSRGIFQMVKKRQLPLPPSRMVRLTPAVYWNHLKGGVDVLSRTLKTLARSNMSENPVVSIIARLLSMQVSNGAVVYRLLQASSKGYIPSREDNESAEGYSKLRHRVMGCDTFGRFARNLAREWCESEALLPTGLDKTQSVVGRKITPAFPRNATTNYNKGPAKIRRLNKNLNHETARAQRAYCVLCGYTLTKIVNGKSKSKKGGSHMNQWCIVCKEPICDKCWDYWHTEVRMEKRGPTEEERSVFEAVARRRTRQRTR